MPAPRQLLKYLAATLAVLLALVALAGTWFWWQMRGSLPQLDGARAVAGLSAPVKVERDALGVPTLTGATRVDVARALGFLHAQDRFFQMDLLRRRSAGELSELFGRQALALDQSARLHGFRRLAAQVVGQATPAERAVLTAYTAGVNAGLAALARKPWEYIVLRTVPQPWREEDTLLCVYAMWFDLQDYHGRHERNRDALRDALSSSAADFLAPRGTSWDAALDGSHFPAAPLPRFRFDRPADEPTAALDPGEGSSRYLTGSNAFAVSGAHTATGAALLANDMHLTLNLPHIWYRAVMQWQDARGPHRLVGVTLPGTPFLIAGSNGHVAWGFTDAYVDTADVVIVEADNIAQSNYRTPHGWIEIEDRPESIKVKGGPAVPFVARWTEWGPIISGPVNDRYLALHWTADQADATNLRLMDLEEAGTTAAAVDLAHRIGLPNENIIIADEAGNIAWTIAGKIPRRVGYDGSVAVSYAYGDRRWDGWLKPEEVPTVTTNPRPGSAELLAKDGLLWTANQRALGGAAYAMLGDGGYDEGARARQVRDDLRALVATKKPAAPADLMAIQLDDRAVFLERWQQFMLEILTDGAVARTPALGELRDVVRRWNDHASVDSAAYRLVKDFRAQVAARAFAPFVDQAAANYPSFSYRSFMYEDALWQLVHDQPDRLLNPDFHSWPELLRAAAAAVLADTKKAGLSPARFTWGRRNVLAMRHPFARLVPGPLARLLSLPADELPGDVDMPRVQGPGFGQSERMVVSPGHEADGLFTMPGGESGHPLSPYFRAGHEAWVKGAAAPLLPGPAQHVLTLTP